MLWSFWTVAFPFMRRDVKHIQACSYWDWDDIDLLEMRSRSCACLFCPALFFHFAGTQCLQNQLKEGHVHNMQWSNFYAWALWGLTLSIQLVQGRRDHGGIDRKLNSDRGGADYTLHTVRSSAIIEPRASCFLHRCPAPITIWCFFKTPEFWRQWTFDLFDFLRKVLPWPLCVLSRQDPFSLTDHYFWSESFAIVDTVCFYNPSKFGVWARKPAGFMHCNRASHEKHRKRGRRGHSEMQPFWTTEALWGERVYQTLHWVLGSHGSGRLAELPQGPSGWLDTHFLAKGSGFWKFGTRFKERQRDMNEGCFCCLQDRKEQRSEAWWQRFQMAWIPGPWALWAQQLHKPVLHFLPGFHSYS